MPGRSDTAPETRKPSAWQSAYIRTTVLVDIICMLVAATAAASTRFASLNDAPAAYLAVTFALPAAWAVAVGLNGGYDVRFIGAGTDEFRKLLQAGITLTAFIAVASYAAAFDFARVYLAIALPLATALDLGARYYLRKRLHQQRAHGQALQRVVAIGHADAVTNLISELKRVPDHGLFVVGACLTGDDDSLRTISGVPVFGGIDDTMRAVDLLEADTVIVLPSQELSGTRMRDLTWELEKFGTSVYLAPMLLDVAGSRTTIRPAAGLPLLHVDHPHRTGAKIVVKELLDRSAAAFALLLLSPVFLLVALAIRADDRGPVFFKQVRVGLGGKEFKVWKFRTMVTNAEQVKARLAEQNEGNGALFKMRKDPRITEPGSWLRRYSLDELPQLVNVVRGEMSLIGPRPALPEETASYDGTPMIRRIVVKPGITGLWQVSGRSDLSLEDSMRLDVHYVENWSLSLDLQIVWKTLHAVTGGSGAY
jgi:exopolysaccharide biosynthesis polyprenyl glycosylphosphotransferase